MWPISALHQSPNHSAPSGPICGSTGRKFLSVLASRSSGTCRGWPRSFSALLHDAMPAVPGRSSCTANRGMPFMLMTQA